MALASARAGPGACLAPSSLLASLVSPDGAGAEADGVTSPPATTSTAAPATAAIANRSLRPMIGPLRSGRRAVPGGTARRFAN